MPPRGRGWRLFAQGAVRQDGRSRADPERRDQGTAGDIANKNVDCPIDGKRNDDLGGLIEDFLSGVHFDGVCVGALPCGCLPL